MKILYTTMHQTLQSWYLNNGRHKLPWRTTDDVYHVYLSEVMLQQTQVKRVLEEYYFQFLQQFPSLEVLATSSLEDVFSHWSGLGYYRRAKNLHASAILCNGKLPSDIKELLKLPGIGKYTAHAVASFGYRQNVSVVDTNISRTLTRLFALQNPTEKELWGVADSFLNQTNPRDHNLALMDLGSLVCLPKNPTCQICPFSCECKGKNNLDLYTKTLKKNYEDKNIYFSLDLKNNQIALSRKKDGMLELPQFQTPPKQKALASFKHSITRFRITVYLYKKEILEEEIRWWDLATIDKAPISSITSKAIKLYNSLQETKG